MLKKPSKLRDALDRHQGKDRPREVQKKKAKQAKKTNGVAPKRRRNDIDMVDGVDVDKDAAEDDMVAEAGGAENDEEDDWEDEEDEDTDDEAQAGFDMSRLEDSDSDSSDDGAGDDSMQQVKDALASLQAKDLPSATKSAAAPMKAPTKATKSKLKASTSGSHSNPPPQPEVTEKPDHSLTNGHADPAEDNDAASDIPLSELSDTGSANEDIVPHRRLTINNTTALTRALSSFALPLSSLAFSEHQTLTTSAPVSIPDIEDDLNRELAFYAQSLSAAEEARRQLKREGVSFTRPTDYFAEMVKSDEHMGKVKGKLVADAAGKKASADAKRQRELKKFGKQVQQERLKERAQEKKQMLDKVNVLKRKRQGGGLDSGGGGGADDMFDVALEDAVEGTGRDAKRRREQGRGGPRSSGGAAAGSKFGAGSTGPPNAKRAKKNEKFGFGGKKRFAKSGDAASAGDVRGFSVKKMKGGGAAKRPGKARRAKARA